VPLTSKGEEIKSALQKEYGKERGESILYAGKNKGTFKGVDSMKLDAIADAVGRMDRRFDALMERRDSEERKKKKEGPSVLDGELERAIMERDALKRKVDESEEVDKKRLRFQLHEAGKRVSDLQLNSI
jgi:hypothetical protein